MNPVLNPGTYRGLPGWHCSICSCFFVSYWAGAEHWHEKHAPKQAPEQRRELDMPLFDGNGNRITHV